MDNSRSPFAAARRRWVHAARSDHITCRVIVGCLESFFVSPSSNPANPHIHRLIPKFSLLSAVLNNNAQGVGSKDSALCGRAAVYSDELAAVEGAFTRHKRCL